MRALLAVLLLAVLAVPALAVQPDEVLGDPVLESRARAISAELRCMVCQNQSIDDSDAPLAKDLRVIVRERLSAGDSDGQVLDFMVARYGEFVLLRPRVSWRNALLWAAPVMVLALGALAAFLGLKRRRSGAPPRLSPEEEAKLRRLLDEGEETPAKGR
ncbi:cytochrome c-type biogenesis protein CcmH [Xanthobacter dioxanivorans]|uniref:Cytochrome c-type biogenesis protein n=1 Tax=Xanthobacter dioxanivorans TaxID=2528964 RepID=A0A974PMB5_9HYPH|nr:cytochrome c-type biogenesis protein [Xanthobacter dioxanivorans]QRG06194.1 cytochrome c-type biogenesis protein CcmH [Xanthobacter dioxanivorans]